MEARARALLRAVTDPLVERSTDPFDTLSICRFENISIPGPPFSMVVILDLEIMSGPRRLVGSPVPCGILLGEQLLEETAVHLDRNFHLYVLGAEAMQKND